MEGRLRANMLWDSIVRYKTERGALGSKTGYPRFNLLQVQAVRGRSMWKSLSRRWQGEEERGEEEDAVQGTEAVIGSDRDSSPGCSCVCVGRD